MKKLNLTWGLLIIFSQLAFSQVNSGSVIEVEAKGRITFAPDSFVVLYKLNRASVNLEDEVKQDNASSEIHVSEEIDGETVYDIAEMPVVDIAMEEVPSSPPTSEEKETQLKLKQERQRRDRIIQDSLNAIRSKRYDEFTQQLARLGIQKPKENRPEVVSYYDEYSSEKWVQVVSLNQYRMADSLSRIFGNPLRGELIDIRMKSNDAIKKKAYAKAMENGRKEGEILASAMNMKLGKVIGVTTESLGIEEILPVMLRKELGRELRRGDNLKPELYQFMQEFDMNQFVDSKYGKDVIEWSWTEKVMIRFQANP